MRQRAASFLCVAYWLMLPAASAEEQKTGSPAATVNASGAVVLHPKPTILRLEMQLEAPGATAKQALRRLKTLRETALGKLKAMKSPPASITFSGLAVEKRSKAAPQEDADAPQGANLPMGTHPVVRVAAKPAVAPGGFAPAPPPAVAPMPQFAPPAVTLPYPSAAVRYVSFPAATISLRAEWPLKGESLEEIVGAAETLKEDVAALDLGRSKPAKEPSSKGKDNGDDAGQDASGATGQTFVATPYGYAPGPVYPGMPPGGPTFFYVASVSDAESKAALVEALAKAKAQGAKLAEIAGMSLGPIVSISEQTYNASNAVFGGTYAYSAPVVSYPAAPDAGIGDKPDFAGPTAESLYIRFQVSAVFSLLPSRPAAKNEEAANAP